VGWVLDADIRAFFDTISHDWLMRFLEHRIGDRREPVRNSVCEA
jgi:retron-type reverse transcriptase